MSYVPPRRSSRDKNASQSVKPRRRRRLSGTNNSKRRHPPKMHPGCETRSMKNMKRQVQRASRAHGACMQKKARQAQLRTPRRASTWRSSSASSSSRAATRRASPCPRRAGQTRCHSGDQDSSAMLHNKGTSVTRVLIENDTRERVSTHGHICQHQPPSQAPAAQRPCARCCSSGTRAGCRAYASTGLHHPGPRRRSGRGARCAQRTSCATRGRPR